MCLAFHPFGPGDQSRTSNFVSEPRDYGNWDDHLHLLNEYLRSDLKDFKREGKENMKYLQLAHGFSHGKHS